MALVTWRRIRLHTDGWMPNTELQVLSKTGGEKKATHEFHTDVTICSTYFYA